MNGVQTRFKCKLDVKRCKRFVFPPSSLLPRSNALKTKAIRYFQTDRTLTRIVSPPLCAKNGEVVISGMALGCDTAAHQGCLSVNGKTIAIVASGLDITHPKENKPLQDRILQNEGLLLSEQVIGLKANPTRLIARNRLQAALCQKLIVAECPIHSGTMHTVRFAQKYEKKIYAGQFTHYNQGNSRNEYLLKNKIALPI